MIEKITHFLLSARDRKHRWWSWIGYLLTITAISYLIYIFFSDEIDLRSFNWREFGIAILISGGIFFISLVIQFIVWARMISFQRGITWKDVEIYSRMILIRRIPGGPWHWIGRTAMYSSSTELPSRVSFLGSVLEWTLMTLIGVAFLIAVTEGMELVIRYLFIVAIYGLCMFLSIKWQPKHRSWLSRFIEASSWLLLYTISWILGFIIFLLVLQVIGEPNMTWQEAMRVWSITASIGMILVIMPATLGVIEVSLVWLLQPFLTQPVALLVAIMIRLIYIFSDAFWGLLGWLISRRLYRRQRGAYHRDTNCDG